MVHNGHSIGHWTLVIIIYCELYRSIHLTYRVVRWFYAYFFCTAYEYNACYLSCGGSGLFACAWPDVMMLTMNVVVVHHMCHSVHAWNIIAKWHIVYKDLTKQLTNITYPCVHSFTHPRSIHRTCMYRKYHPLNGPIRFNVEWHRKTILS